MHDFTHTNNRTDYDLTIYCRKCGFVAFNANQLSRYDFSKIPKCPYADPAPSPKNRCVVSSQGERVLPATQKKRFWTSSNGAQVSFSIDTELAEGFTENLREHIQEEIKTKLRGGAIEK